MKPGCVYRIYDADDNLLYVGCSIGLPSRISSHERFQEWWPEVARITVEHYEDRATALDHELLAIQTEHPQHNVVHRKFTEDELERRREMRRRNREAAEAAARAYQQRTEQPPWDPEGRVLCTNCGRRPEAIPAGCALSDLICKRCRVAALTLTEEAA